MKTFLSLLAIAVIAFVVIGYWQGWISFQQSADKATIDVETREIKEAADEAVDKGQELIDKATEAIEKGDDGPPSSTDQTSDAPRSS